MYDKITILEKQIDKQGQRTRRSGILLHDIPEIEGETTDDIAVKTCSR